MPRHRQLAQRSLPSLVFNTWKQVKFTCMRLRTKLHSVKSDYSYTTCYWTTITLCVDDHQSYPNSLLMINRLVRGSAGRLANLKTTNFNHLNQRRTLFVSLYQLNNGNKMTTTPKCPNIEYIERGARNTENYRVYYGEFRLSDSMMFDWGRFTFDNQTFVHTCVQLHRYSNE